MKLILNIQDSKAVAFIEFIKSLEFISIENENATSMNEVSEEHKQLVRDRIKSASKETYIPIEKLEKKIKFD